MVSQSRGEVVLSQGRYQELMNSCKNVAEMVEKATESLDENWPTIVSAGSVCWQRSANVVHHMEWTGLELRRWIAFLEENAEVE